MRRGEVWTASGGPYYAGKPRPVVIVQSNDFADAGSVTVCGLTSTILPVQRARVTVEPSERNGLVVRSQLMVDKLTTLPMTKLGRRVGQLADKDMLLLDRAMAVFLGLAG
jgi:mRNA interferase MazF